MPPSSLEDAEAAPEEVAPGAPAGGAFAPLSARLSAIGETDTAKAAGLAVATMAANLLAVVSTIVFTRLLGRVDYGSLAALLNLTVILLVPGSALQVATAREGTLGRLGGGGELAATLARWTRHLLAGLAGLAVASVLARHALASLLNVNEVWGAAAVPVSAAMWLLLCVQRGLLQSQHAYRAVGLSVIGEAFGRMVIGVVLVLAGAGVTGAYTGTLASFLVTALVLEVVLKRRLGHPDPHTPRHPLRAIARDAALPIAALTLVAALQNVDVIMAKHTLTKDVAGVYAACTVAAKALVWLAVGLGMWVLPEATRRLSDRRDARPVLLRAFGVIGAIAVPALLAYALIPVLVLRVAFGNQYTSGHAILFVLGSAYAFLALVYLSVQFLLGVRDRWFLAALTAGAIALPVLLTGASSLSTFAARVLTVQGAVAAAVVARAFFARAARRQA